MKVSRKQALLILNWFDVYKKHCGSYPLNVEFDLSDKLYSFVKEPVVDKETKAKLGYSRIGRNNV